MSENPSDDQWMQYHHHYQYQNFDESASALPHHPHGVFFSDSTSSVISSSIFTGAGAGDLGTMNNNSNNNNNNSENSENYSCAVMGNDLSPRGSIGKQAVRRRSRASRRTPTTLLNASIKNFRTLVQQYTGCHQTLASSMKTDHQNNYKKGGPINLSFASPSSSSSSRDPINNNDHSDLAAATITNSLGGRFYSGQDDQEYLLQMCQQQQQQPPADENSGDFSTFVGTDYNTSGQNTMTVDKYGSWHAVLQ